MARPAYERVGHAFRLAYKTAGLRQEDVAAALHVDQGTVSRWARGLQKLDLDYFPQIDDLCGQRRGYLLRRAGYVDDDVDVATMILTDHGLLEEDRRWLIGAYDSARKHHDESMRSAPSATVRETPPISSQKRAKRVSS